MATIRAEEKETNISQDASNRDTWIIFTDDSIRVKEYKSIGLELQKKIGRGHYFILPDSQITIRKKRKNKKTPVFEL